MACSGPQIQRESELGALSPSWAQETYVLEMKYNSGESTD